MNISATGLPAVEVRTLPRIGFAGAGWIGRARLKSLAESGTGRIRAIFDTARERAESALQWAADARLARSFDELLAMDLDGVVIATPSALHAEQAAAALERGLAVFCEKPLARNSFEAQCVLEAARASDRLLGLDLSYRYTDGVAKMRKLIRAGKLGRTYAAELVFHNAYGPDKDWYYRRELSGGGCVIDLGIHLVDLALWMLDWPKIVRVDSSLYAGGKRLSSCSGAVEDYATASMLLGSDAQVNIACSWKLPTDLDAVIAVKFYGVEGGVEFSNVNGSFYDFTAVHVRDRRRTTLSSPPDQWGGRALIAWVERLARSSAYDPECERLLEVAKAIDAIYGI